MGIDWEGLLGAEGGGLQDAYDQAVEDWDRSLEAWEIEDMVQQKQAIRERRRLVPFRGRDPEDKQAVREALEAIFHTKLHWVTLDPPEGGKPAPDAKPVLVEIIKDKPSDRLRTVMTDRYDRIILLPDAPSVELLFRDGEEAIAGCVEEPGSGYPFDTRNVRDLKCEYDADGLPLRVYGVFSYPDADYRETRYHDDYTVWSWHQCREQYLEKDLLWVFQRVREGEKPWLKPVELWHMPWSSQKAGPLWKRPWEPKTDPAK